MTADCITVRVGLCRIEVEVDYAQHPPRIRVDETEFATDGETAMECAYELCAADRFGPVRWHGLGFEVYAHGDRRSDTYDDDARAARAEAYAQASKRWRVFRRRLAEHMAKLEVSA